MSGFEVIGCAGTGIFNQTGGTNSATSYLCVGGCTNWGQGFVNNDEFVNAASGVYNLSGNSSLLTCPNEPEYICVAGTGIFNQTGGTNVAGGISLGGQASTYPSSGGNVTINTPGTYNLYGGLLRTTGIGNNQGSNLFNFSGGTIQPGLLGVDSTAPGTYQCFNGMAITLGTSASNVGTFDSNGGTLVLNNAVGWSSGIITGPGLLRVIDSAGGGVVQIGGSYFNGTSTVSAVNSYTGGTQVLSGTLEVLNYQALSPIGVLTVGGPVSVVMSEAAGTLFGTGAAGQTVVLERTSLEIASASSTADASSWPSSRLGDSAWKWCRWEVAPRRSPSLPPWPSWSRA